MPGMETGFGRSTTRYPKDPSIPVNNSNNNNNDDCAASFECNICFELARDPIVTLCGHLFCWRCLYKWLHVYSHSQECPVCKALVEEDKLVPLYGRGMTADDPRSRSIPDIQIPNRPTAGQRPGYAPPPSLNHFVHQNPWQLGMVPRFGNYTFSAAIGFHGQGFHHHHLHHPSHGQQAEAYLEAVLFLVASLVFSTLILL